MLRRFIKSAREGCLLSLLSWALVSGAAAQSGTIAGLNLYAGLTITGAVGTVYSIECVSDVGQTNDSSAWQCLGFLQLPSSSYVWTDKSGPAAAKRFYRAGVFAGPRNMVFIAPGTFTMGSPTNEVGREPKEGPHTDVTISRGFWMSKYLVT